MPIGNLTSQLFANVYLNEFDRLVRHVLKPLGYVRYGDDFVLFVTNKTQAEKMQREGSQWLSKYLYLTVHHTNNSIFKAKHGIYFLGHRIYPRSFVIESSLISKIKRNISPSNISSYSAQALPDQFKKQLPWMLIDKN